MKNNNYHNFLLRLAYLAKEYSKDFHDGNRNFGTSQHHIV
ncbi:inovirus-type Gp2 protein [Superficieibacter sp.]|nr:inovirus-type Gp2 protein [Superficieibacter sp.]